MINQNGSRIPAQGCSNAFPASDSANSSVAQNSSFDNIEQSKYLIDGLTAIPENWALTPVDGNKRPYRKGWQSEEPLSRNAIAQELNSRKAQGYGIRTGEVSGGILAIDADGNAAEKLLQNLSHADLPDTISFASGKPGRRQLLYVVPEEYWRVVKTIKLKTGIKGEDGKEQQLEFRWNGCQSVVPPSVHPETGNYLWVRSPLNAQVAICPLWVIELMLSEQHTQEVKKVSLSTNRTWATNYERWTDIDWAICYLQALPVNLSDDYETWLKVGMALHSINDSLLSEWDTWSRQSSKYEPMACEKKWRSFKKGGASIGTLAYWAKQNGWTSPFKKDGDSHRMQKVTQVQSTKSVLNGFVTVDNGGLSTPFVDNESVFKSTVEAIVTNVNGILATFSNSLTESNRLDQLYLDIVVSQKLDRKVFDRIVATERLRLSGLEQEEKERLRNLLEASNASIDWEAVLPASLARDLMHDAAVRNIDPVVIWQTLSATVASLIGVRISLDVESHKIPALLWTATVLETGGGKSRGDDLVLFPLRKMQGEEMKRYADAEVQYKKDLREWERDKEGDEPTPPTLRKYLFDIATIQAVVKRCAGNGANGALWGRDELDGLFKSLGQFSKGGSDESLQILLKLWNGGAISSDRASIVDSFYADDSALSVTGGIQPGIFRHLFEDAEDCNGLQARFLFAVPQRHRQKRVKGYCHLSDRLPLFYSWLSELQSTTVKLSPQSDDFYSEIIDLAEAEYSRATNTAVRAWLAKWATQTMRISLVLHVIESFYSQRPVASPLQKETLERALSISQYYRNSFNFLQEKVSVNDELTTILLQLIDRARQSPAGITLRDSYRALRRSIEPLAKESGVNLATFTEQLFSKAEAEGYCRVVRSGRSVKLIAYPSKKDFAPNEGVDNGDNGTQGQHSEEVYCQQEPLTMPTVNGDNDTDYVEHVDSAVPEVSETQATAIHISDTLIDVFSKIEERHEGKELPGVPCGFYDLDAITGGFQKENLVIVAGRTSMGKTALTLNIASNIATLYNIPVIFFSPEMTREEINQRLLSKEVGIEAGYLRSGRISQTQWEPMSRAIGLLTGLPLFVNDTQDLTPALVEKEIEQVKSDLNAETVFVVVDCLRGNDADKTLAALRKIAQKHKAIIVVNLPINRNVETRSNKRPMLSDLSVGTEVESIADLIILLYRDDYYRSDSRDSGTAEVIVAKQRCGPTGTIRLGFDPQFTKFKNLARHNVSYQEKNVNVESAPINTSDTVANCPELLPPSPTVSDRSQSEIEGERVVLKPLSFSLAVGDRITCYPTLNHATNKWKVNAVISEVSGEQGYFTGCTVEYRDKKRGAVSARIPGGSSEWILRKG